MTAFYFVEPIDSLFVRGNLAFGSEGEHGAGVMPPPPSLFAGAFRSAILGQNPRALEQFIQNGRCDDPHLVAALGTPHEPGRFRIRWSSLAVRREGNPPEAIEPVFPLPADLVRFDEGFAQLTPSQPANLNSLVSDNRALPRVAVLHTGKQAKPQANVYLNEVGWRKHLSGLLPDDQDCVKPADLYSRDPRLGIGLNADARTAESGLIYTTEGYAFSPTARPDQERPRFTETGFLVGIDGADGLLPDTGFLRLGGDGRGASYRRVDYRHAVTSLDHAVRSDRFRLILTTPGLFLSQGPQAEGGRAKSQGWLPAGVALEGKHYLLRREAFSARLVCASAPRREVVSGWNLFQWRPKDAQCAVPAGAVYWFEDFQGDHDKLAEWVANGLWGDDPDTVRRAEGFNNATLAAWRA